MAAQERNRRFKLLRLRPISSACQHVSTSSAEDTLEWRAIAARDRGTSRMRIYCASLLASLARLCSLSLTLPKHTLHIGSSLCSRPYSAWPHCTPYRQELIRDKDTSEYVIFMLLSLVVLTFRFCLFFTERHERRKREREIHPLRRSFGGSAPRAKSKRYRTPAPPKEEKNPTSTILLSPFASDRY